MEGQVYAWREGCKRDVPLVLRETQTPLRDTAFPAGRYGNSHHPDDSPEPRPQICSCLPLNGLLRAATGLLAHIRLKASVFGIRESLENLINTMDLSLHSEKSTCIHSFACNTRMFFDTHTPPAPAMANPSFRALIALKVLAPFLSLHHCWKVAWKSQVCEQLTHLNPSH